MASVKSSNRSCRRYVKERKPFVANNIYAEERNGRYVVFSYGEHFPMYLYDNGVWYENTDRYSPTTSKHQTQTHPQVACIPKTTRELEEILYAPRTVR